MNSCPERMEIEAGDVVRHAESTRLDFDSDVKGSTKACNAPTDDMFTINPLFCAFMTGSTLAMQWNWETTPMFKTARTSSIEIRRSRSDDVILQSGHCHEMRIHEPASIHNHVVAAEMS